MEPERENPESEEEPEAPSVPSQPSVGSFKRSMIPLNWQKKQAHGPKERRVRPIPLAPPQRLTNCIALSQITLITHHPGNQVRYGPQEAQLEKPQQLCASWRLQAVKQQGMEKERLYRSDFENTFKTLTAESQEGAQGQAGGESLQPSAGLSPFWKEMIPEAARLLPPSCLQQVSAADIRRQRQRVTRARKRLGKALEADRLASEADRMHGQEERAASQVETGAGAAGGPPK